MDDRYREVLPLLRPRSDDLTLLGTIAAAMIVGMLLSAVVAYAVTVWRSRARVRRAFYAAALERRLTKNQIRLLLSLAHRQKMKDPLLLLTSLKIFDRLAGRLTSEASGEDDPRLATMSAIRRRLGFDRPPLAQRFYTTRTLSAGQNLMVWPHGAEGGFLQCVVVGRDETGISAVPLLRDDDRYLSRLRAGEPIKGRFWRNGDTEYRFRSVLMEVEESTTTIRIRHAESLERVQLRDYYRIQIDVGIRLFAMPRGEENPDLDRIPQLAVADLRGRMLNLSGGGMGIVANGAVPTGSEVIVDPDFDGPFPLAGVQALVVDQTRKGADWHIRLQFVNLATDLRDDLVAAVFGYQARRPPT